MNDQIKCCYPECTQDATCTACFGAETGDEILGQVPLCEQHYQYILAPENAAEVSDLFGPLMYSLPILTSKVKEMWNNEALQRDQ